MTAIIISALALIFPFLSTNVPAVPEKTFVTQVVVTQEQSVLSAAVVLAIDTSDSMYGKPLQSVKDAARDFILSMDDNTPLAIVTFSSRAEVLQDYTTDKSYLLAAVDSLQTNGVTALYDGALTAVNLAASSRANDRIVVLLSDGGEYTGLSAATREDALALAREQNVTIHTIGLGSSADRAYLDGLALATSGSTLLANSFDDLALVYASLSEQISSSRIDLTDEALVADLIPAIANNRSAMKILPRNHMSTLSTDVPSDEDKESGSTVSGVSSDANVGGVVDVRDATGATVAPTSIGSNAIVLAIDTSDSMYGRPMNSLKLAATNFIETLGDDVPVAIVTFSNRAETLLDFTTDQDALLATIDGLNTNGVTALYDGSLMAVSLAASADADNRIVILLSDGGEYGGQSTALRDDALRVAKENGVSIFTIGLGYGADRSYLKTLSDETAATSFDAPTTDELVEIYELISSRLFTNTVSMTDIASGIIMPLNEAGVTGTGFSNDISANRPLLSGLEPTGELSEISPLNEGIADLNIQGTENILEAITGATTAFSVTVNDADPTEPRSSAVSPTDLVPNPVQLISNQATIAIAVPDPEDITLAELFLNNVSLVTFYAPPYEYVLDTNMLRGGEYKLTFSTVNRNGVISSGEMLFEVVVPTILPSTGGLVSADDTTGAELLGASAADAPRILLVDGQNVPLDLQFDQLAGLAPIVSSSVFSLESNESLGEILSRPLNLIPAPILDAITTPRPVAASIIVIVMTIILLPQGLFTMYWMMYTWNNPERAERSRSPKEFAEPLYSFTALLPARKEETVIKDTIYAVDAIDYPEHLKEILILIRDEDDDETIQQAKEAIAELGKDNIRLITFTEGPRNKPNGLNRGLKAATKDVVCIFDAEDEPHTEIYHVINTVMIRDNADVVQSGVQLMNFKSTWFSAMNVLEYFFWFKSGLHCFTHSLNVTPLGGNTVFFKKHWLERIGGWDEATLTEDADVGIRLTILGAKIQIVYDAKHATQEETPDTVEQFIKQRTRWCQGFYEIFFKGDWLRLPSMKQKITAIYILLNSLLQASIVFFLPVGLFIAATQQIPVPIALLSYVPIYLLLMQLVTNLVGIREFTEAYGQKLPFLFRLRMILFYYPFQLMLSVSAMRAIWRFLSNNSAWEKTSHSNLHRQNSQGARLAQETV